jgi:hypothetical protein
MLRDAVTANVAAPAFFIALSECRAEPRSAGKERA